MDSNRTKSGEVARAALAKSRRSRFFGDFGEARRVLRSDRVSQGGSGIQALTEADKPDITLFFLDGDPHRQRRAMIAPFFTLKAIEERYEPIMHRCAERLVGVLARDGKADLGMLAFQYAVAVTAEVLGLDFSDLEGLTARVGGIVGDPEGVRPTKDFDDPAILEFYEKDVQPAIDLRREQLREDVISTLVELGHDDRFIRAEVRGYALAGMLTTREFICMVAWYLLEDEALAARFRQGEKAEQFAILDEVMRLEPVVGAVKREVVEPFEVKGLGAVAKGDILAVNIREANLCEDVVGQCPHAFNPDRENRMPPKSGYMSFSDGPHRCPGAMLSMHESRIFLERLVRLPNLRLVSQPRVTWYPPIASYEVKNVLVACDKA